MQGTYDDMADYVETPGENNIAIEEEMHEDPHTRDDGWPLYK